MKIINHWLIVIFIITLASCNESSSSSSTTKIAKDASKQTIELNQSLYKKFPFQDSTNFIDAKRGLIAPLPNNGVILAENGDTVWNLPAYKKFIIEGAKSPASVNPSLWRQSELLLISGLFEVVPGVYQVRGADLSNMTIVEGKKGITIYDPLISAECSKYALELYREHRGEKPVKAVIYTHSHADHFGGVRGIVSKEEIESGQAQIIAPEGFLEHAIEENVYAGTAMNRRVSYMYGIMSPPGPKGQVTSGLGVTTSIGTVTLAAPTDIISKTGETRVIDGVRYEFIMAPDSEAPSEMMWYLPDFKMVNAAEDAVHTMHNLYTLRGAKTRDASKWPMYLNEVIKRYKDNAEVLIGMHHWPVWGTDNVVNHLKSQRDIYKYMHDQTLHFANLGYTMNELSDKVVIPESLVNHWGTHGYYGSKSHNVRAVYNFYLGYFDGNPAHLDPLPPESVGEKYVKAMGGETKVMDIAFKAYQEGDYRWGAELLNHLIFTNPDNQDAKNLQADMLEQMGYQAECGPWRNFYLCGANELRHGVNKIATPGTVSPDVIANMSLDLIFGYMGIQLDAQKANGKKITINYVFPDTKQKYTLFLENSVLNAWPDYTDENADATLTLDRSTLNEFMLGKLKIQDGIKSGKIKTQGDMSKFAELMSMIVDLNKSVYFNIVTP